MVIGSLVSGAPCSVAEVENFMHETSQNLSWYCTEKHQIDALIDFRRISNFLNQGFSFYIAGFEYNMHL